MTQDSVNKNDFSVTHEVLANILGVRRAGISIAASTLQGCGAIAYRHGRVIVEDKVLLNSMACGCYAACKRAFAAALDEPIS